MNVIRKNLITISAQFLPPGYQQYINEVLQPPPTQPSAAEAVLQFCNPARAVVTTTIPMTLGTDGMTWTCLWDSSACGGGSVNWVVYASGTVQSANQGTFQIVANSANTF
jgi:hypothetical protein